MVVPDLIIKTRRRSLSLIINKNGELVVRAPKNLPINKIMEFISEKERWIINKKKLVKSNLEVNNDLFNYSSILFLGKKYKIEKVCGVKNFELTDNNIIAPDFEDENKFINKLYKWFNSISLDVIKKRIEFFANLMQLNYSSLKISNDKSRWGSCDSNGNIKINFRVVMLPHNFIDYILIHELTHLLYMNHSSDFYNSIECVMPSYKIYKSKLKNYNYVLNLFR